MDAYVTTLTVLGIVILFTAWLPMVLHRLPISLPIICIIFGVLLAWSPFSPLPDFNPLENRYLTQRLTELVVIVTPYIVRAVAQKQLSRPDDGFADPSDPSTALLGRLNHIYGEPGNANPPPAADYHGKYGFILD